MGMHPRVFGMVASAVAVAACLASPAYSQAVATGAADKDGGNALAVEDIVVTAQRTQQSNLDVPLSIQALKGDQLAASGIRQMNDLQFTTPGFLPSNGSGYNQMFIRGIGNAIFVGADPAVATFIDDVPRVFGTLVNNFVDVDRVEVIKGAPGGLYGRNTTGGVINIVTRQPDVDALSSKVRVSYGEKNTFGAAGFINVPLGKRVAWTLSAERRTHDPYVRNLATDPRPYTAAMFPGGAPYLGLNAQQTADFLNSGVAPQKGYNFERFWSVSSKLLFQPTDNFKITLAADYSRKNDDSGNGNYNGSPRQSQASLAYFLNLFTGATPEFPDGFFRTITEPFTVAQGGRGFVRLKDYGGSATAVLNLGGVDLTSITALRKNRSDYSSDLGFGVVPLFAAHVDLSKQAFYQELRLVSTDEGPLNYIAGATFLRSKFSGQIASTILPPLIVESPASDTGYVIKNMSIYAQVGYDLTPDLNLIASGRYIHEQNNAVFRFPASAPYRQVEKRFLPSATLSYKLPAGGNVYVRWARGFKAGGVNPLASPALYPDPRTQGGIFKGEDVDTFEAGVRSPLFNGRAQLTAAAFYNDYRNVQLGAYSRPAYATISSSMVNAGDARTYGAEVSLNLRVSAPVTVGAAAGYLNAKYKKDFGVPASNPVLEPFDLAGKRMLNSPEWQLSLHADLDQPVSDHFRVVGNVLGAYTDDTVFIYRGTPELTDADQRGYWLVNARLGLRTADDAYELAVFAKNLFDQGYITFGGSSVASGTSRVWGEPRIVGIEGTARF